MAVFPGLNAHSGGGFFLRADYDTAQVEMSSQYTKKTLAVW